MANTIPLLYNNLMNSNPPQKPTPNHPVEHVKKIDVSKLMKLAEKAGEVIRAAEERERLNELRSSER
jgi:hypothetical protein